MKRIISSTPSTWEEEFEKSGCSLKFVNGDDVPDEIKRLVGHSKALFLERHKKIKDLSEIEMMNLEQLRVCMLAECKEMETVVDGRKSSKVNDIFSHLLYLYISHMKSLRSIWEGPVPPRCFLGMLKSLVLQNCPELTSVFTTDFLGNLSLLKELVVKDCPKVTTLISDGSFKHKGEVFLPKVRKIMLLHLPKLITISNGCCIGPSLNIMAIYDCPKLQSLSRLELSSQTLEVIKGKFEWWDQLQWSKEEWGISQRPSRFDHLFSPIDNEADVMTQIGNYGDDIDDYAADVSPRTFFDHSEKDGDHLSSVRQRNRVTFHVISEVDIVDDGYKWRKYGQKGVLGSKYPISYYKCAHEGCPVRKKVQRSEEDPIIVEVSYEERHMHRSLQNNASLLEPQYNNQEGFLGEASWFVPEEPAICGSSLVGEVLRIEEILLNNEEEADSKFESLRKLQLMELTMDLLEETEMGKVVKFLCNHGLTKEIRQLAWTLIRGWKEMAEKPIATSTQSSCITSSRPRKMMPIWKKQVKCGSETAIEGGQDDGYSWRKYGQKEILGSKYPRGYYRCTFRHTQICLATKQIQRSDEDPSVFDITYRGRHTCCLANNAVQRLDSNPSIFVATYKGSHMSPSAPSSSVSPQLIASEKSHSITSISATTSSQYDRSLHEQQSSEIGSNELQYPSNENVDKDRTYLHKDASSLCTESEIFDDAADTDSRFDCIFPNEVDIMTQIGNDGDDDKGIVEGPFGPSNDDVLKNNQANSSTRSGIDDNDKVHNNHPAPKYKLFRPSRLRINKDQKQFAHSNRRIRATGTQALQSEEAKPVILYSINQRGNSASNADLGSFSSMEVYFETAANETYGLKY